MPSGSTPGWIVATVLAAAGVGAGCKSAPADKDGVGYVQEYRSGSYSDAYNEAAAAYMASDGKAKDRAAVVAGISAYTMGQRDLAEQWLIPVIGSADAESAGTASWTLGLIAADRGQHARAVAYYDQALPKLKGDDAANVQLAAGESLARLGRSVEARNRTQAAASVAESAVIKDKAARQLAALQRGGTVGVSPATPQLSAPMAPAGGGGAGGGSYVIQLGAFGERAKAERLARDAAGSARRAGLPGPRVDTTSDPRTGRALYAVRVGAFPNRPAAEAARGRMAAGGTVLLAR